MVQDRRSQIIFIDIFHIASHILKSVLTTYLWNIINTVARIIEIVSYVCTFMETERKLLFFILSMTVLFLTVPDTI